MPSRRKKLYQNVVTGKMRYFTPLLVRNLPKREHQDKMYPNGGWIESKMQAPPPPKDVKEPPAFGEKEADHVRKRIEKGDFKGITIKLMEEFAKFEGIEPEEKLDRRGWVDFLEGYVMSETQEEGENEE